MNPQAKPAGSTLAGVRGELHALANPEAAAFAQRFFKTGPGEYAEGDRFLGIRVPQIRKLVRKHRTLPRGDVLELLRSIWHEERLLALLILVEQHRRADDADRAAIHGLYLEHRQHVDNWDLVDSSAEHLLGAHVDPTDVSLLERLAASDSVWDRRISVLATFHWIKRGEYGPTLRLAALLLADRHDLIHKAVGWMLREVGERDSATMETFLRERYRRMPRTMLRYAIEKLPAERRQQYLRGEV